MKIGNQNVSKKIVWIALGFWIIVALIWLTLTVAIFFYPTNLHLWIVWGIVTVIILFLLWLGRMFDQMEDLEQYNRW